MDHGPSDSPGLSRGVVHVWSACLTHDSGIVAELERTLSADERQRADRFHFPEHRDRFILARGLLRSILARYLEILPDRILFTYEAHGKPVLSKERLTRMLTFNVSHSGDRAAYAIAVGRGVGIDIEAIRPLPEADRIARLVCSARELATLERCDESERLNTLLAYWTCKEAYAKARGDGLSARLPAIELNLLPPPRFVSVDGRPREAARWRLEPLSPADGFVGALVVEGHDWELVHLQVTSLRGPEFQVTS